MSGSSPAVDYFQSVWQQHRVGIMFVASVFGAMLVIFTVLMLLKRCEKRRRSKESQRQHYRRLSGRRCPDEQPEVDGNVGAVFILPRENIGVARGVVETPVPSAPAAERQSLIASVLRLMAKMSDVVSATVSKAKRSTDQEAFVGKLSGDAGVIGGGDDLQQVTITQDGCKTPDVDLTSVSG